MNDRMIERTSEFSAPAWPAVAQSICLSSCPPGLTHGSREATKTSVRPGEGQGPSWVPDTLPPRASVSLPAGVNAGSERRGGCEGSAQTGLLGAQEEGWPGPRAPGTPPRGRGLGAMGATSLLATRLPSPTHTPPALLSLFL